MISVLLILVKKAEQMKNRFKNRVKTYLRLHHQYWRRRKRRREVIIEVEIMEVV